MNEPMPAEVEALVLAALVKRVTERQDTVKAVFTPRYQPGNKLTFRSPLDDAKLGYVQRTDPDPEWRITDRQALVEHLAAEFPGVVEAVYELAVPGVGVVTLEPLDELVQVLLAHAPHLLTRVERVGEDAVKAAVEQSAATGAAAAPGITKIRPGGQLRVVPDKAAAAAIDRMVAAGVITWDGRPVLEQSREAS